MTTAIVLVLGTIAFFRRSTQLTAFGRSIAIRDVMKVVALTTVSILVVFLNPFGRVVIMTVMFLGRGGRWRWASSSRRG